MSKARVLALIALVACLALVGCNQTMMRYNYSPAAHRAGGKKYLVYDRPPGVKGKLVIHAGWGRLFRNAYADGATFGMTTVMDFEGECKVAAQHYLDSLGHSQRLMWIQEFSPGFYEVTYEPPLQ